MKRIALSILLLLGFVTQAFATNSPGVENLTLTLADTEYSWTVPFHTEAVTVQSRTAADMKMATVSGESGTNYITIKSGTSYYETDIDSWNGTLYFQSSNAGQVVEILYWQKN